MEGKKISFGFMKTKKADKPISDNNDDKKDYIECVEEQSIKIVGGEKLSSNEPLVIPMKPNSLITPGRLRQIALKVGDGLEEPAIKVEPMDDDKIPDLLQDAKKEIKIENPKMAIPTSTKSDSLEEPEIKTEPMEVDNRPDPLAENETLEQMAVRELIEDAKKEIKVENPIVAIPTSSKGVADGEKESTLDDYDAVPVQEFGLAMLRGMGWTPGQASSKYKLPELRPKGLGLGADKVIKAKPEASKDNKQEEMLILKNSYVKIVCGKYSDYYGKVVSLDEENGRVLVDIPLKKESVSLSEFMMVAVTKTEYDKESKVINSESYEEYKRKEVPEKYSRQDGKKSYLREDGKASGRKEEKENDGRDDKEKRSEKERDRIDEKERRDERERDKRSQKELERRPDKVRESRDERQTENRNERERGRKDRQSENNDSRRRRDQESANGKNKNRQKRDSSSSEDRSSRNKKTKKRYSSSDSLSSHSEDDRKQCKHNKNKSRRRSRSRSGSYTRSPAPEAKREIDKKRKGKKKKRDRDRSPNYKKYRK
ncbi:unnamed protein product [Arctia plantaginis]|uniref:Spp2/MOS2 G-patch domain-containing protein n=1 Tax=Arctia plantaginis TaxID=874455 RepID=A0A8S1BKN7_ARCPL|nr:unnamed protein product [Arctia plantaginis]CAB3260678.1 unnamed protein product [Arctia plantaginis]